MRFRTQIDDLYINHNINRTIPAPIIIIANNLGYDVFYFRVEPENRHISGAVIYARDGQRGRILINPEEQETRNNFTIAHEIGHIVLQHGNDGGTFDTRNDILNPASGTREWYANEFAAELLMPAREFRQRWEETRSIVALSDLFRTSIASVVVRMQVLGLEYGK